MKTKTKQSAHTPGPWKAADEGNYFWIQDHAGKLLASVEWKEDQKEFPFTVSKAEAEANARLMVAGPNLLEALLAIQQGFIDGSIQFTKKRQSDKDPYHKANTLMCAAIEKAEGGTK